MDTSEQYIKMCDCPEIQSKWAILIDEGAHPTTDVHDYSTYIVKENRRMECIWLPRQDQIQEMVGDFNAILPMLPRLERLDKLYEEKFNSMEQLWLAFYMHEKHDKMWDGKKWVG